MSNVSKDILTSSPIGYKFIYQYPRFGNGKFRKDDLKHWRTNAHKIKPTTKGVRWDDSVYYWWFEYLKRHEGYKRFCETRKGKYKKLYSDFGDIHAYGDDFRQWFYDIGFDLFIEKPLPPTIVIENNVDKLASDEISESDAEYIYAAIPVQNSRKHLLREFNRAITAVKSKREKRGKDMAKGSTAKYPVHRIPYINSLKTYLAVWDASKPGVSATDLYLKFYDPLTDEEIISRSYARNWTDALVDRVRKQRYANIVGRARAKANLLIENAAIGVFPCAEKD